MLIGAIFPRIAMDIAIIMPLPEWDFTKGDGKLKQILLSMAAILIAAGIFAGMILYTMAVIRTAQIRILTGEMTVSSMG